MTSDREKANNERRRFTRVRFDTAATLSQADTTFHTYVIDISLSGVLLETPDHYSLRTGIPTYLSICLSEAVEIQMQVTLAHSSNNFLGFHCKSIDMESIAHLRRLIELNMDEPNAAERVLEELVSPFQ